jgi:hypothetical protein
MPLVWEKFDEQKVFAVVEPHLGTWVQMHRAKVIGGWLVRAMHFRRDKPTSAATSEVEIDSNMSITFVPDPNHSWPL